VRITRRPIPRRATRRVLRFGPCVGLAANLRLGDEPIVQGFPVCATPFDITEIRPLLNLVAIRLGLRLDSSLFLRRGGWCVAHLSAPCVDSPNVPWQ
jgi:hypothetical protein